MSRFSLNLPPHLKQQAEALARQQHLSLNQFILWAVAEKVTALDHGSPDQGSLAHGDPAQTPADPNFPHIALRRGTSGALHPVLLGRGLRVQSLVIAHYHWRRSVPQLAADYQITEIEVLEALAYHQAHPAEINANLAAADGLAAQPGK